MSESAARVMVAKAAWGGMARACWVWPRARATLRVPDTPGHDGGGWGAGGGAGDAGAVGGVASASLGRQKPVCPDPMGGSGAKTSW